MELDAANLAMISFLSTPEARKIFFECDEIRQSLVDIFSQMPVLKKSNEKPQKLSVERLSQKTCLAIQEILALPSNTSIISTPEAFLDALYENHFPDQALPEVEVTKESLQAAEIESLKEELLSLKKLVTSMKNVDAYMKSIAFIQDYEEHLSLIKKELYQQFEEEFSGLHFKYTGNHDITLNGPQDLSKIWNHTPNAKKNSVHISEFERILPEPLSVEEPLSDAGSLIPPVEIEKMPLVVPQKIALSSETVPSQLERRPKNDFYLAVHDLCFSITKNESLAQDLSLHFMVYLWTVSLGKDFVLPQDEKIGNWLSQELHSFLRGTKKNGFQALRTMIPQDIFPDDFLPCSVKALFDDLGNHFRPLYASRFREKARMAFDEHFVQGKKLAIIKNDFYSDKCANTIYLQINLMMNMLRDNALVYKEVSPPGRKPKSRPDILPSDTPKKKVGRPRKSNPSLDKPKGKVGRPRKFNPPLDKPKGKAGRPLGAKNKQKLQALQIQEQKHAVESVSSKSTEALLSIVVNDFNAFQQMLGKEFPSLCESARRTDKYTILGSCLDILSVATAEQCLALRNNYIYTKKNSLARPLWYRNFLTELYGCITKKGVVVYPEALSLSSAKNGSVKTDSGSEESSDAEVFIKGRLKVLNNIVYPFTFVLTEELWNENQKTLVSQWKKELKNLSQPGLATLVQKIEDFLKEFPQKYSDLVWFKEVLNVLLSLSSEYPHTFNQPSHLPVNTADVLFE